jgi:hypothetical protein
MSSVIKANEWQAATGSTVSIPSGTTLDIASGATIANSGTATGFASDNTPSFRAYLSTNQTGLTNSAWNQVNFDTEDWDTDGAYDNSTNYRFTVPAGEGGKYSLSTAIGLAPSAGADGANDYFNIILKVNGSSYSKGDSMVRSITPASGYDLYAENTVIFNLAAADYVECMVWHNLGTSRQISAQTSFFSGYKLIGV